MATYKYRQNLSSGASAGYVQYNITPDFGTVLAPGETFQITGKIYSGKKCYGISVEAVHVGARAWYKELGKVAKTISAGKSATFAVELSVPDLSEIETVERQVLLTYINFGFLTNAELDVGETTDRFDDQRLALIKDRIAPVVNRVTFGSGADTSYYVFGGAVQHKTDLLADVAVELDPLDESVEIDHAELVFTKDNVEITSFHISKDSVSGTVLHIGIPQTSGEFSGYRLELTDTKGQTGEYVSHEPFTIFPYSSPRLENYGNKELAERYEVVTLSDGTQEDRLASDGLMLWANFKVKVSPIGGMNVWSIWRRYNNSPWTEVYSYPTQTESIFELTVERDKNIFPATIQFAASERYTVEIEIRDYFETALLRFTVEKAGGYFNVEKYGVAAGMRSTASWGNTKTESAYPVYPYKGIAMCSEGVAEKHLTLEAEFRLYKATTPLCLMQYGNMVLLQGEITPVSAITGSATEHIIAELPEGFAPKYSQTYLCQGTSAALWMLRVYSADADDEKYRSKITFGRYRSGGSYANCNSGNWLPISVSWICGGTVVQEDDGAVKLTVYADGTAMISGTELMVDTNGNANIPMEYLSVYADGTAVIG